MLLAVLVLVFHGGARVMAHPPGGTIPGHAYHHAGCVSAATPAVEPAQAVSGDVDTGHDQPLPAVALDCCTAVCAAVLPALDRSSLPREACARQLPLLVSTLLEGLPPTAPSKPPRTSYEG